MYLSEIEKNAMVSLVQHLVAGDIDHKFPQERKVVIVNAILDLGISMEDIKRYSSNLYPFQTAKHIVGNIDCERRKQIAHSIIDTIRRVGVMGEWGLLIFETDIFKGLSAKDIYPEDEIIAECIHTGICARY